MVAITTRAGRSRSLSTIVLPLLVLWLFVESVVPLVPAASLDEVLSRLRQGLTLAVRPPLFESIGGRLGAFLPLGGLLWWKLARLPPAQRTAGAIALSAAIALVLEVAQAAIVTRHPRLGDFLLATAASVIGVVLAPRVAARCDGWAAFGRRVHGPALTGVVVVGNVALAALVFLAQRGADLIGWDTQYPLIVANELTANRPWLGRIRGLAVYPRALPPDEIARLAQTPFSADALATRTPHRWPSTSSVCGAAMPFRSSRPTARRSICCYRRKRVRRGARSPTASKSCGQR